MLFDCKQFSEMEICCLPEAEESACPRAERSAQDKKSWWLALVRELFRVQRVTA